jgi:DNA (cytosine-5)-methyltransferase 1
MIEVGSDFSGVGAFNQALNRLGIDYEEVFACDMDKYARQTYIHNYGEPKYYPTNVYEREIPKKSLDVYMTSPPCQAFSLAGKRLGKDDQRGILFFNSHKFIKVNKPRYFIFENVKGLLSDDGGKTFQEWVNMLGGKSVNGVPVIFPYEDSVPYHLYWKVLNAKNHGVPQNRERVFLIGIRDDADNTFQFPKEEYLSKRLKDVLEENVYDKYFLSEKMLNQITFQEKTNGEIANLNKGGERGSVYDLNTDSISCLSATDYKQPKMIKVGNTNPSGIGMSGNVFDDNGISPTIWSGHGEGIKIKYNDERLNKTIEKNELLFGEVKAIDIYNKKVQDNVPTLTEPHHNTIRLWDGYKIRKLTPKECFRLMDFPDSFTWPVSDTQAYKQAGNSIVVNVLYKILKNLNL